MPHTLFTNIDGSPLKIVFLSIKHHKTSQASPRMEVESSVEWRCHICRRIPWNYQEWHQAPHTSASIPHHDSFAALEASAARGCCLCRGFRAVVYYGLITIGLEEPPPGPCSLWLPKKSYLDLSARGKNPDTGDWPAVIKFCIGTFLFLPLISVTGARIQEEFVAAAPSSLKMSLEPHLKDDLHGQIHDCINKRGVHQECDVGWFRQDIKPVPPTRLIDIETYDPDIVRLVIPAEDFAKGFIPEYLTLSYCWGATNEPAKTTRANVAERREGFLVESLPQTIRDAIQVTRLLKFQYLWVDAICIIQSDENDRYLDDWNMEAPRIGSYYLHSKCLISASAAPDSSQGLFVEQTGRKYPLKTCTLAFNSEEKEYICLSVPKPSPSEDWSAEPLRTRGWCLQEAVLSPRVLYWSKHSLIWQCHSTTKALSYGNDMSTAQDSRANQSHLSLAQEPERAMGDAWTDLVSRYSKMNFTFETDRLVAIQGLANRLVDLHGDTYFAGVFQSHLADGLLWKNSYDKANHALSGVPTWSWASRCLNIWFLPVSRSFIQFTRQNVFPENRSPINLDTPEKRALRLEAPLLNINLGRPFTASDIVSTVRRPVFSCHVSFEQDTDDKYAVNFEYDAESLMPRSFDRLEVLFLGLHVLHKQRGFLDPSEFEESTIVDPDTIVSSEGIMVKKAGEYYERIGRFDFDVPKNYKRRTRLGELMKRNRKEVCLI
ncbi:hypothetical protein F53441_4293 [Fusarium austroafricanum]|uniref:Heterokaryon incompatibility domain-containing protein n=1 Tax=Fusarium austroafricanum TaxID=2364996 RepID=A0A8H4P9Q3_9HYPO|nr:hypothetical protein F53441_4293 [Fusarium austroafricanum]